MLTVYALYHYRQVIVTILIIGTPAIIVYLPFLLISGCTAEAFIGICSMLFFRLGSGILFGITLNLGVIGVWMAMSMDWLARSVAFTLRYKSGKWEAMKIINKKASLS